MEIKVNPWSNWSHHHYQIMYQMLALANKEREEACRLLLYRVGDDYCIVPAS